MTAGNALDRVVAQNRGGVAAGLPSFCTANRNALAAVLRLAGSAGLPVLVEATCNQVNQEGGYTGMDPAAFRRFVTELAQECRCPAGSIILGGDHLGPNPWRRQPPEEAMAKAREMVALYAGAGFTKIHLDASMACAGEGTLLPEEVAGRAAELCAAARDAAPDPAALRYVIGTEVPAPGGESGDEAIRVTRPESLRETVETHRLAFAARGLEAEFERIVAVVVQPGVDFGVSSVHRFDPPAVGALAQSILGFPDLVFEAHSTDYQPRAALGALVRSRFAFLKVGPELTFAFREAVLALAEIEKRLLPREARSRVVETLLEEMEAAPGYWQDYYRGGAEAVRLSMLFSLSDRIRYYWQRPGAEAALSQLFDNLSAAGLPRGLVSQFLPSALPLLDAEGPAGPARLAERRVAAVARRYYCAAGHEVPAEDDGS